jgi:hypothetical protein
MYGQNNRICVIQSANFQVDSRPTSALPDLEPFIRLLVQDVILVTQLPWANALLQSLSFGGRTVLVGAAHIQRPAISRT